MPLEAARGKKERALDIQVTGLGVEDTQLQSSGTGVISEHLGSHCAWLNGPQILSLTEDSCTAVMTKNENMPRV